ncbi:MAG: hypothetical protein KAW12_25640 [Candidatus Aminicenantes bacterium]|nr:hypothetical protein [Candidatus Aminicenantes bacterium]
MRIVDWFPEPKKLLKYEFDTLRFCSENFYYNNEMTTLADAATKCYKKYYHNFVKPNRLSSFRFDFETNFNIIIGGKEGTAYIGALIELSDDDTIKNVSYYAAIAGKGESKLLRKFHFDYVPVEPASSSYRQPHPVFHLQYAGELSRKLQEMGLTNSHMDEKLKEPRLYYSPISLALLINLIVVEFSGEKTWKLTRNPEWRSMIRKNEDLILKPFYQRCCDFFSNRDNNKLFTNDFYYGN